MPGLRAAAATLPRYQALALEASRSAKPAARQAEPDKDVYAIAESMSRECAALGVEILHSSLSEKGESAILEMSLRGGIVSLVRLASDASALPGYTLQTLRIVTSEGSAKSEALFRIAHAR
jgi:hypothetical protein